MEGHICRQNTLMFALVFCFELRARAARTCCHCHLQAAVKNPIHDGKRGQLKLPKKSWTVPQCGHVTLNCVKMASKQQNVEFSSHIFQFTRLHGVAVIQGLTWIPRLRGHTLQINQVVRTVRHRISCCAPTIHWKCDAQIQNRQIKSPPALWKHLPFQCLGVIVTLNGKSASMLLEPTKNKLKQWRVIEKSVNKCNFFSQMFWIITKWIKITEKQICEDQIVTFKQSHILLYQGLLFLTRSTCVIVDARSHTCKSHDFIPRYDIIIPTGHHLSMDEKYPRFGRNLSKAQIYSKISFAHTSHFNWLIILKFCTWHASGTVLVCVKFQNDSSAGMDLIVSYILCDSSLRQISERNLCLSWPTCAVRGAIYSDLIDFSAITFRMFIHFCSFTGPRNSYG